MRTTKVRERLAAFLALFLLTSLLACQAPALAGKPATPAATVTPYDPRFDPKLVAIWREARRIGSGGQSSQPGDPLLVGFFADGTFKAVLASRRFETYHDFWGEWRTEGGTLTLTIAGGNNLPAQSSYRGRYEVREKELVLHDIVLVGDSPEGTPSPAGSTMVFSYERPVNGRSV